MASRVLSGTPAPPLVLPREESLCEWEVRNRADSEVFTHRQHVPFDPAFKHRILGLRRDEWHVAVQPGGPHGIGDLPSFEVRQADVANFACSHEIIERTQCFLDRCAAVLRMDLVKVYVVGLKPAQRSFNRGVDVFARTTFSVGYIFHREPKLGGDDRFFSSIDECLTDIFFGYSVRIKICGVEEVHTLIKCSEDDLTGGFEIHAASEVACA